MNKNLNHLSARGLAAEERALTFLENKRYTLITRNFRWKGGEGDLVMLAPDGALVLVEVRSNHEKSEYLRYSIGPAKLRRLRQTLEVVASYYAQFSRKPRRLELVWVEGKAIEHWPNPL